MSAFSNSTIQFKPCQHLINIMRDNKAHHPNFVLFLGAGASVNSGVPTAKEFVKKWRDKFCEQYHSGNREKGLEDLRTQQWFDSSEEYSRLFELLYDHPSQRREFIESQLENASPSWGYIYLVNLIEKGVFNTVFTTNFDDLLNEACYLYSSDLRPIVCAHDSSIKFIRLTSKRPKLIKLHGDFLFDNIKNTVRELETLEDNMKEKFRQFASEFGFVFIGYSGGDKSVMDVLSTLLRLESTFPHGIYWCVRNTENLPPQIKDLTRHPKFNLIKISGFDEFFAELNDSLKLGLQLELTDPYKCLASRLDELLDAANTPDKEKAHPLINRDVEMLAKSIKSEFGEKADNGDLPKIVTERKLAAPNILLAQVAERQGLSEEAFNYAARQMEEEPNLAAAAIGVRSVLKLDNPVYEAKFMDFLVAHPDVFESEPEELFNLAIEAMNRKKWEFADNLLTIGESNFINHSDYNNDYHYINRAQILKHKGINLPDELKVKCLRIVESSNNEYAKFGANIALGNFEASIACAKRFDGTMDAESILKWPIVRLLPTAYLTQLRGSLVGSIKN